MFSSKQFLALCVLSVAVLSGVNGSSEVAETFYYDGANVGTTAGVNANAGLNIGSLLNGYASPLVQAGTITGAKVNVGTQVAGAATSATPCVKSSVGASSNDGASGKVDADVSKSGGVGASAGISAGGSANSVSDETASATNAGGVKQTTYDPRSLRSV